MNPKLVTDSESVVLHLMGIQLALGELSREVLSDAQQIKLSERIGAAAEDALCDAFPGVDLQDEAVWQHRLQQVAILRETINRCLGT